MTPLPTALLHHTTAEGSHYDWLLTNPHEPTGRLWTARVTIPSRLWAALGSWTLTPIPPHRRIYLSYQGPLSDNRGSVTRVDEGTILPLLWTSDRIEVCLSMRYCKGIVRMRKRSPDCWTARIEAERRLNDE
jgi:hypothetical protein